MDEEAAARDKLVALSNAQVRHAWEVADGYHAYGMNPNALELGKAPFEACLLGAMGELAACVYYGVDYEPVFEPDEGFDLVIGETRANVKATPFFEDPYLKVMDKLNKNCDIYVLVSVAVTSGIAIMQGWIHQPKMVKMPLRRLSPKLPPCRVATVEDLIPCRRPPA